jgi:predicted dehydrogenase
VAAAGFYIVPRHVLGKGFIAPSDRLSIAAIGVGGKGEVDVNYISGSGKADIAYLCDVDDRRAANIRQKFPSAKYYKDYRELLDKERKHIDAVSISTPDHMHAVIGMACMQLGKHVYIQKPLTHDIYEARTLTQAATRYKVVTQMGNQGASGDGVRQLIDWYRAGIVGDITEVYCFTNRPVWPQGIQWSDKKVPVPAELDWNLWLGTAPYKEYVDNLVPFNWRGWWDYGTGALGDMGCHIIAPAFQVLELGYPTEAECSVGSVYVGEFTKRGYFPDCPPPSSHITLKFKGASRQARSQAALDGRGHTARTSRQSWRPNETFGDGGNGTYFIGTKGKMMCGTYGQGSSAAADLPYGADGRCRRPSPVCPGADQSPGIITAWVDAVLAGYGSALRKRDLSSNFKIAGPLTESVLMGNLAIRSYDLYVKPKADGQGF